MLLLVGVTIHIEVEACEVSDLNDRYYTAEVVKHAASAIVLEQFAIGGVGILVFLEQNESVNQHSYFELFCDNLQKSFENCKASWFMLTMLGLWCSLLQKMA